MTGYCLTFINYFPTPATGLYLFLRRYNGYGRETSLLRPVLLYEIFTCCNIPVSRLFVVTARALGKTLHADSGLYTLVALVSSVIVYGIAVILKEYLRLTFQVGKK